MTNAIRVDAVGCGRVSGVLRLDRELYCLRCGRRVYRRKRLVHEPFWSTYGGC